MILTLGRPKNRIARWSKTFDVDIRTVHPFPNRFYQCSVPDGPTTPSLTRVANQWRGRYIKRRGQGTSTQTSVRPAALPSTPQSASLTLQGGRFLSPLDSAEIQVAHGIKAPASRENDIALVFGFRLTFPSASSHQPPLGRQLA
jgi:hypothetical protein